MMMSLIYINRIADDVHLMVLMCKVFGHISKINNLPSIVTTAFHYFIASSINCLWNIYLHWK